MHGFYTNLDAGKDVHSNQDIHTMKTDRTPDQVIAATRDWIERAVIGLNLCPFAKAVYVRDQIRYTVSAAQSPDALLDDLEREALWLAEADPRDVDTTLIIHPNVLTDFLEYNDFLGDAEEAVERLGLTGVLQVASFHPDYQFADAPPDDITNYTNRSPYPMLHLLREASVDRAIETFPDVQAIYQKNIDTMRRLGLAGWKALKCIVARPIPMSGPPFGGIQATGMAM